MSHFGDSTAQARADLGWFFDQWIYGTEIPTYRVAHTTEPAENCQFRVKLTVRQQNVSENFQMYVPVTLDLGNDRVARVRVKITGSMSQIDLPSCRRNRRRSASTAWTGSWRR